MYNTVSKISSPRDICIYEYSTITQFYIRGWQTHIKRDIYRAGYLVRRMFIKKFPYWRVGVRVITTRFKLGAEKQIFYTYFNICFLFFFFYLNTRTTIVYNLEFTVAQRPESKCFITMGIVSALVNVTIHVCVQGYGASYILFLTNLS